MTKTFYTNVTQYGKTLLCRGVEDGKRFNRKVVYHPTLYMPSSEPTEFTTLKGDYLSPRQPGTIMDCKEFVKKYKGVTGAEIHGQSRYNYAYIAEEFPEEIDWDIDYVRIANIDIEVGSENGFPHPKTADETVTAITLHINNHFHVFGCGVFKNDRADVSYYHCVNEVDLLKQFIHLWVSDYPDAVTGWHIRFFDIPYLVNRIRKLLGESFVKKLSPWGYVPYKGVFQYGQEQGSYDISGVSTLDYIELYRKFAAGGNSQENYKLDTIANVELGEKKLSYSEYENLHKLYRDNFQLFIEYNIRDVELVSKLEEKLKLIELVMNLAYDSRTNYEDVFMQVRMWTMIIINHLKKENIFFPVNNNNHGETAYSGGHVKTPQVGRHKWLGSFDLKSEYPSLIIQYNISPETIIEPEDYLQGHYDILNQQPDVESLLESKIDTSALKELNCTLTANGHFFRKDKVGFLPKIIEKMFAERAMYKTKMLDCKKELEICKDADRKAELKKLISKYNNLQLTKKVCLNSGYGALGNAYFFLYDTRQAEGITASGRLAIRWADKYVNEYMNKILKTKEVDYVVASDTDSIYVTFADLVDRTILTKTPTPETPEIIKFLDRVCEDKFQPEIDKLYQNLAEYTNAYSQMMVMEREALADNGIWTAKKRYILNVYNNEGVQYAEPQVKITGLEAIKSSTPSACREKIKALYKIILTKTEKDVIDFIEDFRVEFKSLDTTDISFPRSVNGLSKYNQDRDKIFDKGSPIHVRGSLLYNHMVDEKNLGKKYEKIKEGEKIKFIYLKEPNTIQSDIIAFPISLPEDLELSQYIDYNLQFNKSFIEPVKILLDAIGWKTEESNGLGAFMR
jgi:DNA polymerase elongation subunit (family B)